MVWSVGLGGWVLGTERAALYSLGGGWIYIKVVRGQRGDSAFQYYFNFGLIDRRLGELTVFALAFF